MNDSAKELGRTKIIVPGLHGSDIGHWQSYFESENPDQFLRIQQENWEQPDCTTWVDQIEQQLLNLNHTELVLIGHSIGCIAIVKWLEKYGHSIKGALLVAPSDAERNGYPSYITGFTPIPIDQLKFPSIVVGSTNDHVTTVQRTKEFAKNWGSRLIWLENAGHVETTSGFGRWPQGVALINELENA